MTDVIERLFQVYKSGTNYNVCQKYLERLYRFKNFLHPSCFRGINENVSPLSPLHNVGSVATALSYMEKHHLSSCCVLDFTRASSSKRLWIFCCRAILDIRFPFLRPFPALALIALAVLGSTTHFLGCLGFVRQPCLPL